MTGHTGAQPPGPQSIREFTRTDGEPSTQALPSEAVLTKPSISLTKSAGLNAGVKQCDLHSYPLSFEFSAWGVAYLQSFPATGELGSLPKRKLAGIGPGF